MAIESIKILYEDKYIVVCVKPVSMPSQPDPTSKMDLLSILGEKHKDIRLVHRLDTMTGGVMVYAKTKESAAALSNDIQNHDKFIKRYLAVLDKAPNEKSGVLSNYLFHDKRVNKAFVVDSLRKGSKDAKLEYEVLETKEDESTLVLVRLYTGRSHQIRAQMANIKCPVYGDGKYGSRKKMTGFALWSYELSFIHPITKKEIKVSCIPDVDVSPWNMFDLTVLEES